VKGQQVGETMEQHDRHLREERIRNHRRQLLEEQEMLSRARKANYYSNYELPLTYPARIVAFDDDNDDTDATKSSQKSLRTSSDFINARLLEASLPLGGGRRRNGDKIASSLSNHAESMNRFVRDLEGTGCYDTVRVGIGMPSTDSHSDEGKCDVTVKLNEKKWYKLHIGGGVNADDLTSIGGGGGSGSKGGGGPKMQFETSASLLNLTGYADITSASYNVDQTGSTNFVFAHDRPLVSCLSHNSELYHWLMPKIPGMTKSDDDDDNDDDDNTSPSSSSSSSSFFRGGGSHTSLGLHASCNDEDYERTRSSREYVRSIGIRLANHNIGTSGSCRQSSSSPESMVGPYLYAEWNASLRDVMPCRCPTHPYKLDCSREVAQSAGTSLKHSMSAGLYLNGKCTDDRQNPTQGYDAHVMGEVAGPPGDVGYWKLTGGWTGHLPVRTMVHSIMASRKSDQADEESVSSTSPSVAGMALHSSFNCGIIRPLGGSFGGAIGSAPSLPLADRFYVGGPGQLRGFLPSGIGPRSVDAGGSSVPGGDSLGGDLFYTSTLAVSAPLPTYFAALRRNGARLFGFANAGTCVVSSASPLIGMDSPESWCRILSSTRLAVGGGISAGLPLGRFEATYAVPLRYGPRDARRSVQFGLSATFG
jgi:outer membrane protein assembly factor BamA